jgi:hypothetical protein
MNGAKEGCISHIKINVFQEKRVKDLSNGKMLEIFG